MAYSIFDSTSNLIDAFSDRAAAHNGLAGAAKGEPEPAAHVFLVEQDNDGSTACETIFAA